MKILFIKKEEEIDQRKIKELSRNYINCQLMQPAVLSAFTAMKAAKAIDKHDIDIIIVNDLKNTMAAISARKISKKKNLKIFVELPPNYKMTKGLTEEIKNNVDQWLLPSYEALTSLSITNDKKQKLSTFADNTDIDTLDKIPYPIKLMWVGNLDKCHVQLKNAIDAIDSLSNETQLIICGTGKAKYVMPVVKHSQHIKHPERIVWKGNDYNIREIAKECGAVVQSDTEAIPMEIALYSKGRCLIKPDDIAEWCNNPIIEKNTYNPIDLYITELINICNEEI